MSAIEIVIEPRLAKISEEITVKRILPFRLHRMVGPFCFLDQMGPHSLSLNSNSDVLPHPHIGLSTVTYLFEGQICHRDSLGSVQVISPGDLNWMTAGNGITHSERMPDEFKQPGSHLYGLQAWVALPKEHEEGNPSFTHYGKAILPRFTEDGVEFSLIAGSAMGYSSPAITHSKLFYLETKISPNKILAFNPEGMESAFYLLSGKIKIEDQIFDKPTLIVFKSTSQMKILALEQTHGMILGGKPLEGPRFMYWNFVASNKELLEEAKVRWRDQRFPKIPGESEFIALPEEKN